jgi:hypothetical protein
MTKIVYDLVQRFEVIDGVPTLLSSNIQIIEGGDNLLSIAQEWLIKNTDLLAFNKQQYIGYKTKGDKRYQLVLSPRTDFLQVSFLSYRLKDLEIETEHDTLFPYAIRTAIRTPDKLKQLLQHLFNL